MVSSELSTDIYVCVGFGLAFAGAFGVFFFHFGDGIWWIFGGLLIFTSPFLGSFMDDELEKKADKKEFPID